MALSAFTDKPHPPTDEDLRPILGAAHDAEGRGVRFEVRNARKIPPLAALAEIKSAN